MAWKNNTVLNKEKREPFISDSVRYEFDRKSRLLEK